MIESIFEKMIPKDCFTAEWFYSFCNELWGAASKYDFNTLKESVDPEIVKTEYAKGDIGIHRGYYSPSPLYDTVVGGVKRGQLQKRYSERSTSYVYSFDSNGHLIKAEQVYHGNYYTTEFILNENLLSIGLCFDTKGPLLKRVTTELYRNGNIVQFLTVYREPIGYWKVICEHYHYTDDVLKEMHQIWYNASFDTPKKRRIEEEMGGYYREITDTPFGHIYGLRYSDFQIINGAVFSCTCARLFSFPNPGTIIFKKPKQISFAPARVHWK